MRTLDARHFLLAFGLARERAPSFTDYPFSLPAVRNLKGLTLHPHVTFLIGLAYPDATIYSLEPDGIRQLAYEETEHYQITRRFLSDHRAMLAHLLD